MSLRGLIIWSVCGALAVFGMASLNKTTDEVLTLESGLGEQVVTSRL